MTPQPILYLNALASDMEKLAQTILIEKKIWKTNYPKEIPVNIITEYALSSNYSLMTISTNTSK